MVNTPWLPRKTGAAAYAAPTGSLEPERWTDNRARFASQPAHQFQQDQQVYPKEDKIQVLLSPRLAVEVVFEVLHDVLLLSKFRTVRAGRPAQGLTQASAGAERRGAGLAPCLTEESFALELHRRTG